MRRGTNTCRSWDTQQKLVCKRPARQAWTTIWFAAWWWRTSPTAQNFAPLRPAFANGSSVLETSSDKRGQCLAFRTSPSQLQATVRSADQRLRVVGRKAEFPLVSGREGKQQCCMFLVAACRVSVATGIMLAQTSLAALETTASLGFHICDPMAYVARCRTSGITTRLSSCSRR